MDKREAIKHIEGLVDAVNNEYAVSQEDVTEAWCQTEAALIALGVSDEDMSWFGNDD